MLEILVSSSVLILVLAILRLVLRDKISARLQYALWLLVLVRLLVPVSFFHSPVSVTEAVWPVTDSVRGYSLQTGALSTDVLSDSVTQNLHRLGVHPEWDEYVSDGAGGSRIQNFYSVRQVGHLVWYAGSLGMAVWFLVVNLRLARRLKKNRTPYDSDSLLPVYVAEGLPSPCLFGLLRPSIYLTEHAAEDDERARQIEAHELTHYRHGDMIWSLLRSVCLVVWWFNPLVWLAAALSRQDCELACDEGTIKVLGEDARFDYGRTLVGMAKVGTRPSDLLCGATTMTTGKKSLKERVERIAKAPKMSVTVALIVLIIAALAVGCTYGGAAENKTITPEIAAEAPSSASASDADSGEPTQMAITIYDPDTGGIVSFPIQDRDSTEAMYALYRELLEQAVMPEPEYEFPIDDTIYSVNFLDAQEEYAGNFQVYETGLFLINRPDISEIAAGIYESADGVMTGRFRGILTQYGYMDIIAQGMGAEPIGTYDREYWEEVERELGGFARSQRFETSYTPGFDPDLPEDDMFGPLTLADYIYGTDSWRFTYDSEPIANDPAATIKVLDDNDRTLWIMNDADALMIEEADGSITWVDYAGEPVDCADMIRHLLNWARGEYPSEEELAAQREEAMRLAADERIAELGYFGLPELEPVHREGGYAYPLWMMLGDPRNPTGPYVGLYFGTDEMSADLRYERIQWNGDANQPLGAESLALCRSFFAESETVTDVKVGGMNGFITDGGVYAGPRIVWYNADADLLFSLIAYHCDGGQPVGSYSTDELITLAERVSAQ